MSRHYSSSDFVDWLRAKLKIEKPYALGLGQWEVWNDELKKNRPIAYFLTETLPDWCEYPARWTMDPINDLRYYVRMRWAYQSHKIDTGLEKGRWHECETRMLHGMFNMLVDYVEVEKANQQIMWGDREHRVKYNVPWWRKAWMFHWGVWRCREAGLDHLKWECNLDNPDDADHIQNFSQAQNAREVVILYTWWKDVRLARTDDSAYEVTGYAAFNRDMDEKYGERWIWGNLGGRSKMTAAEQAEQRRLSDEVHQLEEQWHKEDDDMLIRLVKLRRTMWT